MPPTSAVRSIATDCNSDCYTKEYSCDLDQWVAGSAMTAVREPVGSAMTTIHCSVHGDTQRPAGGRHGLALGFGRLTTSLPQHTVEDVGHCGGGQFVPQHAVGAVVDAGEGRLDPAADNTVLVGFGCVHGEQRAGLDGVVHVEQGDVFRILYQIPAGPHAATRLHQAPSL